VRGDQRHQLAARPEGAGHRPHRGRVVGDVLDDVLGEDEVERARALDQRRGAGEGLGPHRDGRVGREAAFELRDAGGLGFDEEQLVRARLTQAGAERADAGPDLENAPAHAGRELLEHEVAQPSRAGEGAQIPEVGVGRWS